MARSDPATHTFSPTYLSAIYLAHEAEREATRARADIRALYPDKYCHDCHGRLTRGWCFECDEAGVMECAA